MTILDWNWMISFSAETTLMLAISLLTSVLIRHHKDFPVELLQNQRDNKILNIILFRHNQKYRCLLLTKHFSIDSGIKAQYLLQFGIEEGVQSGERCGKNRLHGLLCGI